MMLTKAYNLVGVHDRLEAMSHSDERYIPTKFIPKRSLNDGVSLIVNCRRSYGSQVTSTNNLI
jgi:hypothetical protein